MDLNSRFRFLLHTLLQQRLRKSILCIQPRQRAGCGHQSPPTPASCPIILSQNIFSTYIIKKRKSVSLTSTGIKHTLERPTAGAAEGVNIAKIVSLRSMEIVLVELALRVRELSRDIWDLRQHNSTISPERERRQQTKPHQRRYDRR